MRVFPPGDHALPPNRDSPRRTQSMSSWRIAEPFVKRPTRRDEVDRCGYASGPSGHPADGHRQFGINHPVQPVLLVELRTIGVRRASGQRRGRSEKYVRVVTVSVHVLPTLPGQATRSGAAGR